MATAPSGANLKAHWKSDLGTVFSDINKIQKL